MGNAVFSLINTTKTTLGPASLTQYLLSKGIKVNVLYAPKDNNFLYELKELFIIANEIADSDVVGFSSFTISEERTLQLMRYIKNRYPKKHLILGGPNAILDPERLLNEFGVDSVCIHEGEIPVEKLIIKYRSGNYKDIHGLWFKENGQIIKNPYQKPLQDIDEIPLINYKKSYKKLTINGFIKETNLAETPDNPCMPGNSIYVMASRGCQFSCSYCINSTINKINKKTNSKTIRKRSNYKLISELNDVIINEPDINAIFFFDDDFLIRSVAELRDFEREYKNRIKLPFHIFANPNSTTKSKIDICYSAGLRRIEYGLQTVSSETLNKYERRDSSKKIVEVLQYIKETGYDIDISIDFITNSPFETDADILENINFIMSLPGDFTIYVHNLHLFPGSKLRKQFDCGTGNEYKEYQNNIIEGKVFNEYFSKLLMAMQGFHCSSNLDKYGSLSRNEIGYFIKSINTSYNDNLAILNKRITLTEVATHYLHQNKKAIAFEYC